MYCTYLLVQKFEWCHGQFPVTLAIDNVDSRPDGSITQLSTWSM